MFMQFIQEDNIVTELRSDEIRAYQEEIERLRRELYEAQSANQAKETFLSSMSHDIRTPMNAIVGMTMLAKNHIDEKNRVMDALDKIEAASGHLLSLINDVLDMSRINSGRMQISEELFQLSDLLHEILVIVRAMSSQKGHELVFETGDIVREALYGDALRLRQVFVNIISNSVKYTKDGGRILVRISEEETRDRCVLCFECEDNGIGMSKEFLQKIFDPFERVNSSTVSGIEGTGLGMSIVKKLIEAMDGEIEVESEEGVGTTVRIRIPLRYEKLTVDSESLRGARLLILENDPKIIGRYEQYLKDTGVNCSFVKDSAEAVSTLTEADFRMDRIDGFVIGRLLGNNDTLFDIASYVRKSNPSLPILLVDDCQWEEIEYRAERAGIDLFLPIPFFRKSLIQALIRVMSRETHGDVSGGIPDLSGKTILLAEDNLINREIAAEILRTTNAVIETAENGEEALELFESAAPGHYFVILMDIQMPVMDGYTAVGKIRTLPREDAASVPIYAMTANAFAEDIEKARKAGMNGHLAKPIDVMALMQVLRQVFMQG